VDRTQCIEALVGAGMTEDAATWLFHDQIAWRPDSKRSGLVAHYVVLAQEDGQLRKEE
jgi:hypothetical protein